MRFPTTETEIEHFCAERRGREEDGRDLAGATLRGDASSWQQRVLIAAANERRADGC